MIEIHRGARSSVAITERGEAIRVYRDTGRHVTLPHPPRLATTNAVFRGTTERLPLYLVHAEHALRATSDVEETALALGVRVATVWNYACLLVEKAPHTSEAMAALVWSPLFEALSRVDARGSLREVSLRLATGPLRENDSWRRLPDRLAHLRLARLCLGV